MCCRPSVHEVYVRFHVVCAVRTWFLCACQVVDAYRGYLSSWVPQVVVMIDRRDWGGGGDDPEESTQRMIERIWESLTDIRMRMDQQAPVPLVVGEAVPVALVPPPPGVEVPFVAPVPSSLPVIAVEEPVEQVLCEPGC
ncbi:hypothetical protein Taro_053749 [Colocasia esculenta]|uniref:Uncharacterized protein n=1 Tax=Colocasia esculenta TaxID=4460 RepID=A0A843XNJ6_COLES|nr:hypothetical protein [Colocasia esculenta]